MHSNRQQVSITDSQWVPYDATGVQSASGHVLTRLGSGIIDRDFVKVIHPFPRSFFGLAPGRVAVIDVCGTSAVTGC